jgi:hypothetical protein
LLWHPAPWSVLVLIAVWRYRRSIGARWSAMTPRARRAVIFVAGFVGSATLLLSPLSRFAERYVFSANYALAALGVVVACHAWPEWRTRVLHLVNGVPGFAAILWLALMLLRLTLGPWLPRISVT